MNKRAHFIIVAGFILLLSPFVFASAADDPEPAPVELNHTPLSILSLGKADWKINNSDYFGMNVSEQVLFDKDPSNETGLIRLSRDNTLPITIIPFIRVKTAGTWYNCRVWNFTETPTYGVFDANGAKKINYTLGNERLRCNNESDKDNFYYENFTIKEIAVVEDNGKKSFKFNITLWNESSVANRGFGFDFLSGDNLKKFGKMKINKTDKWLNDSTISENSLIDNIELLDENSTLLKYKWVWSDMQKDGSKEKIKQKKVYWDDVRYEHTIQYFSDTWGSGSSWELDPIVLDYQYGGTTRNVIYNRHIVYDKTFNDWVFFIENMTGLSWVTCTDVGNNATCTARGNVDNTVMRGTAWQNISGNAYFQIGGGGGSDGRCYSRTANGTLTARGSIHTTSLGASAGQAIVTNNNTIFIPYTDGTAKGINISVTYDNCATWNNMTGGLMNSSNGASQMALTYIEFNKTLLLVGSFSDSGSRYGFNYSYCTWNMDTNSCLNNGNWSTSKQIGNITPLGGLDPDTLTCTADIEKAYCYWINSSVNGSTKMVQAMYHTFNDTWTLKDIAELGSGAAHNDGGDFVITAAANVSKTHKTGLLLLYVNNTSASDSNIRYAQSNDSGVTWDFKNFNLTNNTVEDLSPNIVFTLNQSNSAVTGFVQAVYAWVQKNGSNWDVWTDKLTVPRSQDNKPTIKLYNLSWSGQFKAYPWANNTSINNSVFSAKFEYNDTEDDPMICDLDINTSLATTSCINNTNMSLASSAKADGLWQWGIRLRETGQVTSPENNQTEQFSVLLDTTKPNITNTSKLNTTVASTTINISWWSNDTWFVENITLQIDNYNYSNYTNSTPSATRDRNNMEHWYQYSNVSGGNHTVRIFTNDSATNLEILGGGTTWIDLSSNTVPRISWQHSNNTYNKTQTVSWVNLTFNFTDPDDDVWVATLFVNSTNTSFNNSVKNNTPTNLSANLSDGIWNLYVQVSDNSSSNNSEILFLQVSTDFDGDNFNATFDCNNNNVSVTPLNNNSVTEINRSVVICPANYVGATVTPITNTTGMRIDFNNSANLSGSAVAYGLNFTAIENVTVVGVPNISNYRYAILSKNANNNTVANVSVNAENISLNGTIGQLILLNVTHTSADILFEAGNAANLLTQWYVRVHTYQQPNQSISSEVLYNDTYGQEVHTAVSTDNGNGHTKYKVVNVSDKASASLREYNNWTFRAKASGYSDKSRTLNISQSFTVEIEMQPLASGGGISGGGISGGTVGLPIVENRTIELDITPSNVSDYKQPVFNISGQNITGTLTLYYWVADKNKSAITKRGSTTVAANEINNQTLLKKFDYGIIEDLTKGEYYYGFEVRDTSNNVVLTAYIPFAIQPNKLKMDWLTTSAILIGVFSIIIIVKAFHKPTPKMWSLPT